MVEEWFLTPAFADRVLAADSWSDLPSGNHASDDPSPIGDSKAERMALHESASPSEGSSPIVVGDIDDPASARP